MLVTLSSHVGAESFLDVPSLSLQGVGRRQALMGALRREDLAVKDVARLQAELEGMKGLLKVTLTYTHRTLLFVWPGCSVCATL